MNPLWPGWPEQRTRFRTDDDTTRIFKRIGRSRVGFTVDGELRVQDFGKRGGETNGSFLCADRSGKAWILSR